MIPDKIKSVINSCETHETLDTCIKWIDSIYPVEEQRKKAYKLIKKVIAQIEICGAKVELINKTQIA